MLAIKNGKIITEDEILLGKAVVFTDTIQEIVEENEVPKEAEILDAKGGYVCPGLIELHLH